MTKVYELPNDHRMIADIDESTRICTITETLLDSLISKLIYYAEGQDEVLDKIRAEIKRPLEIERYADTESAKAQAIALSWCIEIIDKYRKEQE